MGQVPQRREADAYSIDETAEILQFHPDAIRYWVRVGELPSEPDPRGSNQDVLVRAESIVAFLRQNGETLPAGLPSTHAAPATTSATMADPRPGAGAAISQVVPAAGD